MTQEPIDQVDGQVEGLWLELVSSMYIDEPIDEYGSHLWCQVRLDHFHIGRIRQVLEFILLGIQYNVLGELAGRLRIVLIQQVDTWTVHLDFSSLGTVDTTGGDWCGKGHGWCTDRGRLLRCSTIGILAGDWLRSPCRRRRRRRSVAIVGVVRVGASSACEWCSNGGKWLRWHRGLLWFVQVGGGTVARRVRCGQTGGEGHLLGQEGLAGGWEGVFVVDA